MAYDPVKAHEYYERKKQLKGRKGGQGPPNGSKVPVRASKNGSSPPPRPVVADVTRAAVAKVSRLKSKVSKLQGALSEAEAALSQKRLAAAKEKRQSSDGKSTAKEKQASEEYRKKHQQEIASKRKREAKSGGGSSPSSNSVSDMSVDELQSRIIKINGALKDAKRQLSNATQQLGQLAHSDLTSEPTFNEHFARFRSAERIPSK
jgi:chromosome segregation ATPase